MVRRCVMIVVTGEALKAMVRAACPLPPKGVSFLLRRCQLVAGLGDDSGSQGRSRRRETYSRDGGQGLCKDRHLPV